LCNIAAALAAVSGPLSIGALTKHDPDNGWRTYYWIQMGVWGATAVGIFVGYRPPKRHTRLDHLTFVQKLGQLDLPGFALLTAGLTLFLTGLNLGGGLYSWTNARTLATLITGIVVLLGFFLYEWKGTRTGILSHELFQGGKTQGRSFAIFLGLMFVEGVLLFSYIIFYPVM
jgi:MFS family permease